VFQILTSDQFVTTPWKNGGGVTHEIARQDAAETWAWRVSIAEVAAEGPFSRFDGMMRILTVIEGNGIDLHMPDGVLKARLMQPLRFSGEVPVEAKLTDGPVRDLNVIFNPALAELRVEPVAGQLHICADSETTGFLCLSGAVSASGLNVPPGAFALGSRGEILVSQGASGILITISSLS
jgi:environmental stress-induced protein Ves